MFVESVHRRSRRRTGILLATGALVLTAALAACGVPASTDGQIDPTATANDGLDLPGPVDPDDPDDGPPPLTWFLPGPSDPTDPSPESYYGKIRDRQCEGVPVSTSDGAVWVAAALVCDALATADPDTWAQARTTRAEVDVGGLSCLDQAAAGVIDRALAHYEQYGQPESVAVPSSGDAGCPLELTGLATEGELRFADTPATAPVCGDVPVRLVGLLMDVTSATVDGVTVPVRNDGVHRYVFTAPPHAATDPDLGAVVLAHGPGGVLPGEGRLTYLESDHCGDDGADGPIDEGDGSDVLDEGDQLDGGDPPDEGDTQDGDVQSQDDPSGTEDHSAADDEPGAQE